MDSRPEFRTILQAHVDRILVKIKVLFIYLFTHSNWKHINWYIKFKKSNWMRRKKKHAPVLNIKAILKQARQLWYWNQNALSVDHEKCICCIFHKNGSNLSLPELTGWNWHLDKRYSEFYRPSLVWKWRCLRSKIKENLMQSSNGCYFGQSFGWLHCALPNLPWMTMSITSSRCSIKRPGPYIFGLICIYCNLCNVKITTTDVFNFYQE